MKAYLATTGTIFALIALAHLLRAIAERSLLATDPSHYLLMSALGVISAALSVWAWSLFRHRIRA
jgi:hypothetical protein